jgi:phage shock protein A
LFIVLFIKEVNIMALIDRLARLFQADLHAVLDRIEEPEVLLRQAIREMEDELTVCERRIVCLQQEQQQLLQRQSDIEQSVMRLDEELEICFDSGNDNLARGLIKRKLEAQLLLRAMARRREALDKDLRDRQTRLQENRTQYESMRQKAELLAVESQAAAAKPNDPFMQAAAEFSVHEGDVEIAMLREKQRRERKSKTGQSRE